MRPDLHTLRDDSVGPLNRNRAGVSSERRRPKALFAFGRNFYVRVSIDGGSIDHYLGWCLQRTTVVVPSSFEVSFHISVQ